MTIEDNKALVSSFFSLLSQRRIDEALERLDKEVILSGTKTKEDLVKLLTDNPPDLSLNLNVREIVAGDSWVAVKAESNDHFTTKDEEYTNQYLFLMKVDGKTITEVQEYRRTVNANGEDVWIWPWPWPWPKLIQIQNIDQNKVATYVSQQGGIASIIWPWPWPWPPRP